MEVGLSYEGSCGKENCVFGGDSVGAPYFGIRVIAGCESGVGIRGGGYISSCERRRGLRTVPEKAQFGTILSGAIWDYPLELSLKKQFV